VLPCADAQARRAHAARRRRAVPLKAARPSISFWRLKPAFFDSNIDPTITAKTPPAGDILTASANNCKSA
jgi:hypothetical protein